MASAHRVFAIVGLSVGVASLAYSIYEEKRMAELHRKLARKKLNGLSKGKNLSEYDPTQLLIGAKHELEHTRDLGLAMRIAADHLEEHADYYQRIKKAGL